MFGDQVNTEVEALNESFTLAISMDNDSEEPLHQHISGPIQTMVVDNRLDSLPLTARHPSQSLTTEEPLQPNGSAAHFALPPIHRKVSLTSLFEDLKDAGLHPKTKILEYKAELADAKIAELLECDEGTEVVHLKRLRYSRGYPLAILNNLLTASKTPCRGQLADSGLYECLKSMGSTPVSAFQNVEAKRASKEEAALLQIDEGSAVIAVERTVYSHTGEVLDVEEDVYDASQYLLTFSLDSE